jgi:hypothetical protein
MDFTTFKESKFYQAGIHRYHTTDHTLVKAPYPMFDNYPLRALSSKDPDLYQYDMFWHRTHTVMHLIHALEMNFGPNLGQDQINWLPSEFKDVLKKQWIETNDIVNSILDKKHAEGNRDFRVLHGKFQTAPPGIDLPQHIHQCAQTMSCCYTFKEDKIESAEPSNFKMGKDMSRIINIPDADKLIFKLVDDPFHQVHSNEWRFWWFTDFSDHFDIPEGLPFHYWNDPFLDNNNLDLKK